MTPDAAADTAADTARMPPGWRWAPFWVLAFVALWPAPGVAEGVLALGALVAIGRLLYVRFRGGGALLSAQAWALTSVLFFAYWTPELIGAIDAVDRARAFREVAADLRYLPFLWLAASAVANPRGRRTTFTGLAVIVGAWTLDALAQAVTGTSPLFFAIDSLKQAISGRPMCSAAEAAAADRLSGVLGPCNLKLGQVLASLSPFVLYAAALLAVGLFIERFFCRYLCPLGAALAIPGRMRMFQWLRRWPECGSPCQRCANECPVQSIHPEGNINVNECIYCMHCQELYRDDQRCPHMIQVRLKRERREALSSPSMKSIGRRATISTKP